MNQIEWKTQLELFGETHEKEPGGVEASARNPLALLEAVRLYAKREVLPQKTGELKAQGLIP